MSVLASRNQLLHLCIVLFLFAIHAEVTAAAGPAVCAIVNMCTYRGVHCINLLSAASGCCERLAETVHRSTAMQANDNQMQQQ